MKETILIIDDDDELRIIVPSMVAIVGGFQVAFTALFITLLTIHSTQD